MILSIWKKEIWLKYELKKKRRWVPNPKEIKDYFLKRIIRPIHCHLCTYATALFFSDYNKHAIDHIQRHKIEDASLASWPCFCNLSPIEMVIWCNCFQHWKSYLTYREAPPVIVSKALCVHYDVHAHTGNGTCTFECYAREWSVYTNGCKCFNLPLFTKRHFSNNCIVGFYSQTCLRQNAGTLNYCWVFIFVGVWDSWSRRRLFFLWISLFENLSSIWAQMILCVRWQYIYLLMYNLWI